MSLIEDVVHTVLYLDINPPEHHRVVDVSPTLFCTGTNWCLRQRKTKCVCVCVWQLSKSPCALQDEPAANFTWTDDLARPDRPGTAGHLKRHTRNTRWITWLEYNGLVYCNCMRANTCSLCKKSWTADYKYTKLPRFPVCSQYGVGFRAELLKQEHVWRNCVTVLRFIN